MRFIFKECSKSLIKCCESNMNQAGDISRCRVKNQNFTLFFKHNHMRRSTAGSLFAMMILLASCNTNITFKKEQERINALSALQQADVDFSNLSRDSGMRRAFLTYMDDEAVLLRPGRYPIIGADAVDLISSINDSSFTLTWRPDGADIAQSGDMGYTYGVYNMQIGDSAHKGTYVTVWKKDLDGNWKFCLDSGNEGLSLEMRVGEMHPGD